MKSIVRTLAAAALVAALAPVAVADEKTHRKAAEVLLQTLRVEKTLQETIDPALDMLIRTYPQMNTYKAVLRKHLSQQLSWDGNKDLKDEWAKMYMEEFSEPELAELTKFYQTPLGQKLLDKQPKLTARAMEFSVTAAMKNQAELKKLVEAEAKKGN